MGKVRSSRSSIISNYLEKFIKSKMPKVAYFSMEFGVDSDFNLSIGERGELAGDFLKAAKDFRLPIIGIGIKWSDSKHSFCKDKYEKVDNEEGIDILEDTGVEVNLNIKDRDVACRVWKYKGQRSNNIYLLDTNLEKNHKQDRMITSKIYSDSKEEKIAKEIVLAVGGVKLLEKLNINVDKYHFNGTYALFSILYLLNENSKNDIKYNEFLRIIRRKCIVTIHNYIDNSNTYSSELLRSMIGNEIVKYISSKKEINEIDIIRELFKYTKVINGVSILHSKELSKTLNQSKKDSLTYVTNGIHIPSWVEEDMVRVLRENKGFLEKRLKFKERFINDIYDIKKIKLDKDVLLIGIGGTAGGNKRNNLIMKQFEKVEALLNEKKIQIVYSFASKPKDEEANAIINDLNELRKLYPQSVIGLDGYNMDIERSMVTGVDLWLNSTRRLEEACGLTSIKAAMNGVLNLATMSGCWPEVCVEGINGWQIGSGVTFNKIEEQDAHDMESLYDVLINKIIPTYYGNKEKWKDMILQSIKSSIEYFSIERMIIEYYDKLYK